MAGQLGNNGNICADPLFCDPGSSNLRLQGGSPCAPEHNPDCGLIGPWPVGCWDAVLDSLPTGSGTVLWSMPNPFVGGTTIGYRVEPGNCANGVSVEIYDVSGRAVRTLQAQSAHGATGQLRWDGTDDAGRALPGGVYLLRAGRSRDGRSQRGS